MEDYAHKFLLQATNTGGHFFSAILFFLQFSKTDFLENIE